MTRHLVPRTHRRGGGVLWLLVGLLGAFGSVVAVARSRGVGVRDGEPEGGRAGRERSRRARSRGGAERRGDGRSRGGADRRGDGQSRGGAVAVDEGRGTRGGTVPQTGTAVPVNVRRDRRWRPVYVLFLIGPVIWLTHFAVVYLVAEAGCTGDGPGLELANAPVPSNLTVVATIVAAVACLVTAEWGRRWWQHSRDGVWFDDPAEEADPETVHSAGTLAIIGAGMSLLSFLAVLFVGVSGVVFPGC